MSSKKDERRDDAREAKSEEQTSFTSQQQPQQEEIREAMIDAFEEAKDNTQRAVQEARKEIPRYTEAVNNYQEQILESVKEIAENYIDSQKDIINSFQQLVWISQIGNAYQTFWSNWVVSPREMIETYAIMVSRSVDNTFTATRLANNIALANMEAFRISMQQTKENVRLLKNSYQ
ncbi:MAG: hypothetical protein ACRD8W_00220 [Nitrososphaeraceae archaeon]